MVNNNDNNNNNNNFLNNINFSRILHCDAWKVYPYGHKYYSDAISDGNYSMHTLILCKSLSREYFS